MKGLQQLKYMWIKKNAVRSCYWKTETITATTPTRLDLLIWSRTSGYSLHGKEIIGWLCYRVSIENNKWLCWIVEPFFERVMISCIYFNKYLETKNGDEIDYMYYIKKNNCSIIMYDDSSIDKLDFTDIVVNENIQLKYDNLKKKNFILFNLKINKK